MTVTAIVIILILLIALVFTIWTFTASKTPENPTTTQSVAEGYTNLETAGYHKNMKQLSYPANAGSILEEDIARIDRDYIVVFPAGTAIVNTAKKFFGGSVTTNWGTPDAIKNALDHQMIKNTGMLAPTLINIWPICNLRENSGFYFPLLFTGDTIGAGKGSVAQNITITPWNKNLIQSSLSDVVNIYSNIDISPKKTVVERATPTTIVGDIYPLSSWDHDGTINPYNTDLVPGKKYYSARVRNVLHIERLSYNKYFGIDGLRVEVNKCSPIPFHSFVSNRRVTEMNTNDSILRIYSNPNGDGSDTGEKDGQYIPSRFKEEYSLLKPKLSILNTFFATNQGVVTGLYTAVNNTPRYSNVDGVQGTAVPAHPTFYDLGSVRSSRTALLSSQSFDLPPGVQHIAGIIPTILLNPYVPVQKAGYGTTISSYANLTDVKKRKEWYEKVARGRVRSMAQSRQCSNTGTIAYVFDGNGYILWVEPIRFFNLQRNLGTQGGTFPTETTYYKSGGKAGDKDRRPGVSMGNVREGTSSQSFPLLAPFSAMRDYVTLDNPVLNRGRMTFGPSSTGSSTEMFMAARSVNNVFFDFPSSIISGGVANFTGFTTALTPMIDKLRSGSESASNSKIWKYPIGGFEFLNVSDTKYDLFGAKFEDFTGRTFDLSSLSVGSKHNAISKDDARSRKNYQNFLINAYTHNYYFPWVANHRTKYLVIENCTANTKCMVALNLKITKYNSSAMDPNDVTDISPGDMFCYYSGAAYDKAYDFLSANSTANGLPIAKLVDYGYNYPEYNAFSGDRGMWNTYPLIGPPYLDASRGWAKDGNLIPAAAGNIKFDDYMLRSSSLSNSILHYSSTLLDHRGYTGAKTIIVVLNEPVFLSSVSFVSRNLPKNTNEKWEKAATSGLKLTDKDVTFRNTNYVTLYNNNSHCISSYIMNDSIPTTSGKGISSGAENGVTSTYNTNVLNYATFGPTTKLERSKNINIYPE